MYQKFVLHVFELRISCQNMLYMWISEGIESHIHYAVKSMLMEEEKKEQSQKFIAK